VQQRFGRMVSSKGYPRGHKEVDLRCGVHGRLDSVQMGMLVGM
jgi:hypothetical protein